MSNRYLPDTWLDALMLPLAMVQPATDVYVETEAPDARLLALGVSALAAVGMWAWRRGWRGPSRPVAAGAGALLAGLALALGLWLLISGNGRYGLVMVALAPFSCVALLRWASPGRLRGAVVLVLALLAVQLHFLHISRPQDSWTALAPWRESHANRYTPAEVAAYRHPETQAPVVVTADMQTGMTLLYEVFGPHARYVSLVSLMGGAADSAGRQRLDALLANAPHIYLSNVVPAAMVSPEDGKVTGIHGKKMQEALPRRLKDFGLVLNASQPCQLLPARLEQHLNICPLVWQGQASVADGVDSRVPPAMAALLARLQQKCPRVFGPDRRWMPVSTGDWRALVADGKYDITISHKLDVHVEHRLDVLPRQILNARQIARLDEMSCAEIIGAGRQYWWDPGR